MKILYVITGLSQGGAERVVCDLADAMCKKGNEVQIVYLTGEILTLPISKKIKIIKIGLNSIASLPKSYLKLRRVIRNFRPDVVHTHMVHANILTRLVRTTTSMNKLICTAHNSNEGGRVLMLLYRLTHSLADTTTNVSKEATLAFEHMGAVPNNGMITVYNGISLKKFHYIPEARAKLEKELGFTENHRVILAVGRFSEQKDYPNLLYAVSILKQTVNYSFKLIVSGDGELRKPIEDLIDKLGLQDDVVLLGRRNDIPELMSAADLFVLSSKYEGFGLVVAEAMACECLVVATDCGGVAEVLNNRDFLVEPSDSIALSNKIKYALSIRTSIKKTIIQKNKRYVQDNFSLDNIANEWVDLYNEK